MAVALTLRALALALAVLPVAQAQAHRTVSDFLAAPATITPELRRCLDDDAHARRPVCANAQRAADILARHQANQRRTLTPKEVITSPAYYAENRIAQAIVLDQCRRGRAAPDVCAAARAAGR